MLVLALASVVVNGFTAHPKSRSVLGWVVLGPMFNPIPLIVSSCPPARSPFR